MSESQTPMTDEIACPFNDLPSEEGSDEVVPADFARELESELTATRARLAELEGIAERLCFRMGCGCGGDYGHCETCRTVINELEAYKEGKK